MSWIASANIFDRVASRGIGSDSNRSGQIRFCAVVIGAWCLLTATGIGSQEPVLTKTVALLQSGVPTTIVCLGDSVTGIYYHTGGRRAYPEMLAIALTRQFPSAKVRVINAGRSGTTTADALNRLDSDVLVNHPNLVTIMFGLNDIAAFSTEKFKDNLNRLVVKCRAADAEVLLCTPNGVEETRARPIAKLAAYSAVVRNVGNEQHVPVAEAYGAFEVVRQRDPKEFALLLSDPIHPNMDGHKLTASIIARVISGRTTSIADEPAPTPALPHTLSLLASDKPIQILAMPPFDVVLPAAVRTVSPSAKCNVMAWNVDGKSLAEIESDAERVRASHADLVVVALPWMRGLNSSTEFARTYGGIINRSLSFGKQEWDVLVIPPSLISQASSDEQVRQDQLVRRLIRAQDLPLIAKSKGDASSKETLTVWLRKQLVAQ